MKHAPIVRFRNARPTHRLTQEAEAGLIRRYQSGDRQAGTALIRAFEPLVASIVAGYRAHPCDRDDLMQAGRIGVLKAADEFDFSRGVRLGTYAPWHIRAEIRDAVLGWSTVYLPEWVDAATRKAGALGLASPESIIDAGLVRPGTRAFDGIWSRSQVSLDVAPGGDGPSGPGGKTPLRDRIPSDAPTPEQMYESAGARGEIESYMTTLTDRERTVFARRWLEEETLAAIANDLGVSAERVRQIEANAYEKVARKARKAA